MLLRTHENGNPRFEQAEFDIRLPSTGPWASRFVVQSLGRMLDLSRQAAEIQGHSYKGFNVGSAIMAQDTGSGQISVCTSGNFTPHKEAGWGCAERGAFEAVERRGFNKILAIAVAGPPYVDSISGVESPTCQPCDRCRNMMQESPMVDGDTLVATVNLDKEALELYTVGSLVKWHETKQPQPFPDTDSLLMFYWDQILARNFVPPEMMPAAIGRAIIRQALRGTSLEDGRKLREWLAQFLP